MANPRWMNLLRVIAAVLLVAYPVVVWLGLSAQSPRAISLILLCVLAPAVFLRMRASSHAHMRGLAAIPLVTLAALGLAALLDQAGFILAVPVAINAVMLCVFGVTLRSGAIPMVERFALMQVAELTVPQQSWCRMWTRIWCFFFIVNGGVALALALAAPMSWWAFYNGLLAYVLIGALLATEWWLRHRRFPEIAQMIREEPPR